ncbi:hypothetical protein SNEBB_008476 [Seison nebaliae]|nr:hypothetical protein SNEBB_008476 [Seison nebaliae]
MKRLLIKGGEIVNDDNCYTSDVFMENGTIRQIGKNLRIDGQFDTIDASGMLVMPGGIDPHTHMNMGFMGTRTADDFFTGTRAAIAGGTTMIIDFVNPDKTQTLLNAYEAYRNYADGNVCCDYGLHMILRRFDESIEKEMEQLVNDKGINSFKGFMAYKNILQMDDCEMYLAMKKCAELKSVFQVHAENGDMIDHLQKKMLDLGINGPEGHLLSRPVEIETEAVNRVITLAKSARCPLYIVHVMNGDACDIIKNEQNKPDRVAGAVPIIGETIAAAVGSTGKNYFDKDWRHAAGHVLSPPLKTDEMNVKRIIQALASNTLSLIGSDHCTFNANQKALGKDDFTKIPNGVNGVEERMMVLWKNGVDSGIFDKKRFVAVTSTNAAKIFNIYPKKGRIAIGSDADICIWHPNLQRTITAKAHSSAVDFNIFENLQCSASPRYTIVHGQIVYENDGNGKVHESIAKGLGIFISTPNNSEELYSGKKLNIDEELKAMKVDRAPYNGPVIDLNKSEDVGAEGDGPTEKFNQRPPTRAGTRNQQETSFQLNGNQWDDKSKPHTSSRVTKPPGGRSEPLW